MKNSFWAQYEDPDNNLSDCVGPVIIIGKKKEYFSLNLIEGLEDDLTPRFEIDRTYTEEKGTAQLFSDSGCTVAASDLINFPNSLLAAYELSPRKSGKYDFWAKVIYENGLNKCIGPVFV